MLCMPSVFAQTIPAMFHKLHGYVCLPGNEIITSQLYCHLAQIEFLIWPPGRVI